MNSTPNNDPNNETGSPGNRGWETLGGDPDSLKAAMRHFPSGVTIITSGSGENAEGMTANAILSVSLEPPLMLASVHKDARLNTRIKEEKRFAISILAEDQEGHSRLFSSPERSSGLHATHSLGHDRGEKEAPLASGAIAAIECELSATYPGGDHDLFLGRVTNVHLGDTRKNPLVYHEGEYPKLKKGDSHDENRAFMDSPRGYDARLQNFQRRKRK
ncbi:MAG: flavin reductase family protein [Actinomycetota bacterium]|jgi:flavin reductase (DIM6/NTAB) family NADH-FMN oxidoreductase RutF|nr:flavin reductase [Rubrobacter sp.]MDQ3506913.1 flavin reductase family protein [Actinomycetota bacterium]